MHRIIKYTSYLERLPLRTLQFRIVITILLLISSPLEQADIHSKYLLQNHFILHLGQLMITKTTFLGCFKVKSLHSIFKQSAQILKNTPSNPSPLKPLERISPQEANQRCNTVTSLILKNKTQILQLDQLAMKYLQNFANLK